MAFEKEFVLVDKRQHNLRKFDCGKPALNEYLARYAVRNSELGINRTWVLACELGRGQKGKQKVAAFYTLATHTVKREHIPTTEAYPGYDLPVVLLAQLAVDAQFQGQGLGGKTLVTAIRKAVSFTQVSLPAIGLVVDVLDDNAMAFYRSYQLFEPFTDNPMRLFTSIKVLAQI